MPGMAGVGASPEPSVLEEGIDGSICSLHVLDPGERERQGGAQGQSRSRRARAVEWVDSIREDRVARAGTEDVAHDDRRAVAQMIARAGTGSPGSSAITGEKYAVFW